MMPSNKKAKSENSNPDSSPALDDHSGGSFEEHEIWRLRQDYEHSNNPLIVWRAYRKCRAAGLEIPEWIFEYLDQSATNFAALTKRQLLSLDPIKNPLSEIAKAIQMNYRGQGTVFSSLISRFREVSIASQAREAIEEMGPGNDDYAYEKVAKKTGKDKSTIRRIYLNYEDLFSE